MKKTYIVDIDDTLLIYPDTHLDPECRGAQERYSKALPNTPEIDILNKLYKKNTIILYTGRGWHQYKLTIKQLKSFNINYDQIMFGKPTGIWVDRDFKTSLKECL
jgi:hypothetical protein